MKLPNLIGVTGTNGAGKDSLAELLRQQVGYAHASLSDILREELSQQGLDYTRRNMSQLSQSIRQQEGDGAMAKRLLAKYDGRQKLCVTSIRTPGEAAEIQRQGGIVIWVDADPRLRYRRIQSGNRQRASDQVSYQEFLRQEAIEMTPTEAGGGLNMAAARDRADYTLDNSYATFEEFAVAARDILKF